MLRTTHNNVKNESDGKEHFVWAHENIATATNMGLKNKNQKLREAKNNKELSANFGVLS